MKSIHRSILTRALMTGVASLAFVMVSAGGVRAEIVTVQGDDGAAGANGVNPGDNGMPGGDGESVSANAGSAQPITAPLNKATATGGNGGQGGNGAIGSATAAMAAMAERRPCVGGDDPRLRLSGGGRQFLRREWRAGRAAATTVGMAALAAVAARAGRQRDSAATNAISSGSAEADASAAGGRRTSGRRRGRQRQWRRGRRGNCDGRANRYLRLGGKRMPILPAAMAVKVHVTTALRAAARRGRRRNGNCDGRRQVPYGILPRAGSGTPILPAGMAAGKATRRSKRSKRQRRHRAATVEQQLRQPRRQPLARPAEAGASSIGGEMAARAELEGRSFSAAMAAIGGAATATAAATIGSRLGRRVRECVGGVADWVASGQRRLLPAMAAGAE